MEGKETALAAARPPNPALPYREDCWSEGATSTLIDAWGERYLELNRGNLRQKHWQEVADVVNARRTAVRRPTRTDIQCKNRIDTLKKKYKAEKVRISGSGGGTTASQWPFYARLDALIGPSLLPSQKASPPPPPLALPLPYRKGSPLPAATAAARPSSTAKVKRHSLAIPMEDSSFLKRKYSAVAAAAAAAAAHKEEADSESSKSSTERSARGGWKVNNKGDGGDNISDDAEGVRELARAILRFGEIYERVEAAKQQQMLELEKQRMEFAKGLEFQRMQIFVDSQVQLEKLKRAKSATSESYS